MLGFINELQRVELGAGTVRNVRDVMRLVLSLAVKSGSLKANPVTDIPVSRTGRKEMVFLEPDQIMTLAAEVGTPPARYRRGERRRDGYPDYGLLVRFAGFTGLRAGELVALRRKRLDLSRRVEVRESASEAYGALQIVATKTYESRTVPVPVSLTDELTEHVAGLQSDDFVWRSPQGGPFRYSNWFKRHFKPAVVRVALPAETRFHDLASQLRRDAYRPGRPSPSDHGTDGPQHHHRHPRHLRPSLPKARRRPRRRARRHVPRFGAPQRRAVGAAAPISVALT